MATTITKETIRTVKTIEEARVFMNAAINEHGNKIKTLSIFVWADTTAGIEVKVSTIESTEP
jgi:hypothetical protein